MRDLKIKPGLDAPKAKLKNPTPKDADSILKQHMDKRQREKEPDRRDPVRYATDRVEKNMRRGAALAADSSRRMIKRDRGKRKESRKRDVLLKSGDFAVPPSAQNDIGSTAASPRYSRPAEKPAAAPHERGRQKAAERRGLAEKRNGKRCAPAGHNDPGRAMPIPEQSHGKGWRKSAPIKDGRRPRKGSNPPKDNALRRTPPAQASMLRAKAAVQRKAQREMLQGAVQKRRKAVQKLGGVAVHAVKAIGKAAVSAASSLLTAGGGIVVLVLLLTVILAGAIVASPFGILFSNESREQGVVPMSAAIAQVNSDFNAKLEALQTADSYGSIFLDGQGADWVEILAVFAVKVAGADADAADVATMDEDRIARLQAVFWDMTAISHRVETIEHSGSGEDDDGWTEKNLHITISVKTAEDMKTLYRFDRNQTVALEELLEQRELLLELLEDVYSVSWDTAALIRNLPEDLSPEREAVVRTACSLVGKVNYFWGGKSLVLGWDPRWRELRKVTAADSYTTGTYRPYGLDCSGFVDWAFYNQSGGSYVIGHGGGAASQHGYCDPVSWEDALPGDLVFSEEDSHVGIVGGRDENGDLRIIHCAAGYNNVVITGREGFVAVARPRYFAGSKEE